MTLAEMKVDTDYLYKEISVCRVCQSGDLRDVLSLDKQQVVDFVKPGEPSTRPVAPLDLCICTNCLLLQLRHSVNPKFLFSEFWYRSGVNEMMKRALADVFLGATSIVGLAPSDVVLDVGCNDGTLLEFYPKGIVCVGIEPCENVAIEASNKAIGRIYTQFFSKKLAADALQATGRSGYSIITAIAMFYDLEDPAQFLTDCRDLLDDDAGILVVQMNYLGTMLSNNAFDNICHEHLTYFSLTSFKWMSDKCGLKIVDAELNQVNGGSIRITLAPLLSRVEAPEGAEHVESILQQEKTAGLHTPTPYHNFGSRVRDNLQALRNFVARHNNDGMAVYGASTRGMVTLQAMKSADFSLDNFRMAAERDSRKFGLEMAGTGIEIFSEELVKALLGPKYFFVLPWHFLPSILEREKEWAKRGGIFIVPMPTPRTVKFNEGDDKYGIADSWLDEPIHFEAKL